MSEEARVTTTYIGTELGTHTGWDQSGIFGVLFYDFIPNEAGLKFLRMTEWKLEDVVLNVDFETGVVELYQDLEDGQEVTAINPDWSVFNK